MAPAPNIRLNSALVGRLEPRDWIDVIACHERLQPLGYLAWAASGKDPGFTPPGILTEAQRSSRYGDEELAGLQFEGTPPSARDLSRRWRRALEEATAIVGALPVSHLGEVVMTSDGALCRGDVATLEKLVAAGQLSFHRGRLGGALPQLTV